VKKLLVTGSSGLIGSEVVEAFCTEGWETWGIDNNMRATFFGAEGDTRWNQHRLQALHSGFHHLELDIRDREGVRDAIRRVRPQAVIHTAAQPSHDWAASAPFEDFDVNAVGTLNLLEAVRNEAPECVFVHLSTNKVYGDAPNRLALKELDKRYDYADQDMYGGIAENFTIDQSMHSLFGASKLAADIAVQEYGRYFQLPTVCLRGGCLTGPHHSGVELHGFLNYLIKCNLEGREYTVFGYKGKQVRDNIHSLDVVRFIKMFIDRPRVAEVYNLGGGRENSISILESFDLIESISGKAMRWTYDETNRQGDHICYISNLEKMKAHYPQWSISRSLEDIFQEIHQSLSSRNG
jgi:CDP-paratose 2-epimerase